jgi:large subunit ribosomal protein L37Ae
MVSRYGKKIRERESAVTALSRGRHACTKCGKKAVKREGAGIWKCRACGVKFAGGAYSPQTTIGATASRTVKSGSAPKE